MLGKKRPTSKVTYFIILFCSILEMTKLYRRKTKWCFPGARGDGKGVGRGGEFDLKEVA